MKALFRRLQASSFPGVGVLLAMFASLCLAQQPDTANLLKTAVQGTGQARYVAIDDLGERHVAAAKVVPELEKLLKNDDGQVRWRSARALGDYGPLARGAAPALRALLADKDPIVQYHAAVALGRVGDKSDETVRDLVAAATSPDGRVARAAIAALRNVSPDPKRVLDVLQNALASDDDAVTLYAMEAIVERGAAAVPLLNEALKRPETTYLACAAIEHIGPPAAATVPALTELIADTKHSQLLIGALLAVASIGPAAQSAGPQIIPLLEHSTDATVPVAAAYALGSIGAVDADAALRQTLMKDQPFLQMTAAWSLAKIHPEDETLMKQAVGKLTKGLSSDEAPLRTAAAKGLQMLQAPPELVAPALMAVANDPDPDVAANIVQALAGLGEAVVPRASKALQNPKSRGMAVRVLTQLGPKAAGAVGALVDAMPGADPDFRKEIHFALAAIGPNAAPAAGALAEAISNEDPRVRESALYALRQIGPGAGAAVKPLLSRMQADESFDAMAAAWALAAIAPDDAEVAAKTVPRLTLCLSNPDEQVRLECAEALASWGPVGADAVKALERVVREDDSPAVRAAAEAALARIAPKQ
ncbi:MAG: HEAT repeat domain-containing protein [Planctomycetes bacterium]|nr:HEAT repeat domain-containing protein [Planctomycetota bacterium]